MRTGGTVPYGEVLTAKDWPTAPERKYAEAQEAVAEHYDVDIDSYTTKSQEAGRIHYLEAGNPDGEPVLLLHGLSATAAYWLPMCPALGDEYRLIIPDRPGRGLSAAPSYKGRDLRSFLTSYLVDVLEDNDMNQPHVVGNSLGGLQAFLLTIDHDRTDRLGLVGAPAGLSLDIPLPYRLLTVRGLNRVLYALMTRGDSVENAREQIQEIIVEDDSAIPEVMYEMWGASTELPGRLKSLRSFANAAGSFTRMHPIYDITGEVLEIERPTSFIWGTEDYFFEPEVGRPVADRMADAEFHLLEGQGHVPWLEPSDDTERLAREFLDG